MFEGVMSGSGRPKVPGTANPASRLSLVAIAGALRRGLPEAHPETAVLLGEGWNATAWRMRGDAHDWVVRVPKLEWAAGEIERQTCLGNHLAELGLPVPRGWRVLRDKEGKIVAGVYEYVSGGEAAKSGQDVLEILAVDLATFLMQLHDLPNEFALRECSALPLEPWSGRYRGLIETYGRLAGPRTQSWLKRAGPRLARALASYDQPVLLHGDLAPEHVICDADGRLAAVLDFSGPQVSDPAIDFGRLVQRWGVAFAKEALRHYRRRIDAGFEERMVLYARLEPLRAIEGGVLRELPEWIAWGRKQLGVHAAAERRAGL